MVRVPTTVNMIQFPCYGQIGPVDGKLVVCVQLVFHSVGAVPGIVGARLKHKHPVIDSRTIEIAQHVLHRRRRIGIYVGSVDDIPFSILLEVVKLRRPAVVCVRLIFGGFKGEFDLCVVPVC